MTQGGTAFAERPVPDHAAVCPLGGVTQAATLVKRPGDNSPAGVYRTFGRYALVYVLSGDGRYEQPGRAAVSVSAGDLITVFPDVPHRYPVGRGGWREFYLVFSGPVFEAWDRGGMMGRDRPVQRLEPIGVWERLLRGVIGGEPVEEVVRMQSVLARIAVQRRRPGLAWLYRAKSMLEEAGAELSLAGVAEALAMSYPSFRRRFSAAVGISPGRYRAAKTIERACGLLEDPAWTNERIAWALGFADGQHFSRRFKALTGRTPTQFRQLLKQAVATRRGT